MDSGNVAFHQIAWFFLLASQRRCNGNTRLVGSQGSTETYASTTRTCITRARLLGYFPSYGTVGTPIPQYP